MTKILFVCHGNICRSPMAEFVMKDLVKKAGLESQFQIASAATSTEETGNPVYPPARRKPGISMGLPSLPECELWRMDQREFRECAKLFTRFAPSNECGSTFRVRIGVRRSN